MEQELHSLLQGITLAEFKLMYLVGVSGFVLRFLFNLGYGIWWDPNTPKRFHLPSFTQICPPQSASESQAIEMHSPLQHASALLQLKLGGHS